MNVNKLSIKTFIPEKGFKTIHVKNPADESVKTFLSIAHRNQKQEAFEVQLAKAMEERALSSYFAPGYFETLI